MIRPVAFVDASLFTAHFVVKYKEEMVDGILPLRDLDEEGVEIEDTNLLKRWKSARALLAKVRNGAAESFGGTIPELGRSWVETVPPESSTPWTREEGDYARAHVRLRVCLIPSVDAFSCSGKERAVLGVGVVNHMDHTSLCCELNLGQNARTHLIVDIRVPDDEPAKKD